MYAFVVKNDEGTWDIFRTLDKIPIPDREERLANAIASKRPITGMDLTPYRETATSGALWDGEKFSGGAVHPMTKNANNNWEDMTQYGYICDNVLLIIFYSQPGTDQDDQFQAIFNSETTIVKLPDGQTAKFGDIWDGKKVVVV